jgi:DNA-binding transcriptional regulator YiaG
MSADRSVLAADDFDWRPDNLGSFADSFDSTADNHCRGHDTPVMTVPLHFEARHALSMNQRMLAEFLGLSSRTVQRWDAGKGHPSPIEWHKLARATHATNPELAARLAKAGGSSLQELGFAPAEPPPVDVRHLADGVVCARSRRRSR